jgi:quinol monooxygenase YgiN
MIIRSAVLEGKVADADRDSFDGQMRGTVREAIATYPGILDVKLRWPAESEAGAPEIYVIFDLYFHDLAAMHAALASPTRQAVRAALGAIMPIFQGRVYHLVLEEN